MYLEVQMLWHSGIHRVRCGCRRRGHGGAHHGMLVMMVVMMVLLPMMFVVMMMIMGYARRTTSHLCKLLLRQFNKGIFLYGVLFEEIEHRVLVSFLLR